MKKNTIGIVLFLAAAALLSGCGTLGKGMIDVHAAESSPTPSLVENTQVYTEAETTPTPPDSQVTKLRPSHTITTTPLPYVECPENGKGVICFGDYYHELPSTAWEHVDIVPEYIILHWDGRPAKPYEKWLTTSTWNGLSSRLDGGRSAHFAVGLDGVGQFLPMYENVVKQSRAASYYMDPHCINIEIAGVDFDVVVTGEAEDGHISAIEEVSNLTLDLVVRLMDQYNIPLKNILGHYQVLEGKEDPGELWLQEYFLTKLKVRLADIGNDVLDTVGPVSK